MSKHTKHMTHDEIVARLSFPDESGANASLIDRLVAEARTEVEKALLGERLIRDAPISFAGADIMERVREDSMRTLCRRL